MLLETYHATGGQFGEQNPFHVPTRKSLKYYAKLDGKSTEIRIPLCNPESEEVCIDLVLREYLSPSNIS